MEEKSLPETESIPNESTIPEEGPTSADAQAAEQEPKLPFYVTLYLDDAPPLELVVTSIEPLAPNPATGRYSAGVIEQKQSEPGDMQIVFLDWSKVYAIEVGSITTKKRR